MTDSILEVVALRKAFGGLTATDDVNLDVRRGEVHAVIGPNGAGKTTLIAQLSGMLAPDGGTITFDGDDITRASAPARARAGLARSFQITSVLRGFTALGNVALGIQSRQGHSYRFWKPAAGDPSMETQARELLGAIGLEGRADVLASNLAHGEQRQLELAMALALEPKLLLLDEPMAGMGAAESEQMTQYLSSLKGRYAMLLVEHDMGAVFALADRISVLVYGRIVATGTPEDIRNDPAVREAYLGEEQPSAEG
jgi:branched-chain amino acid transport system ATP-binding protein